MYILCVVYERAYHSINSDILWRLIQQYGRPTPETFISLIRNHCAGLTCEISHTCMPAYGVMLCNDTSETRVPYVIFYFPASNRLDNENEHNYRRMWTRWSQLDDLDFANGVALLSYRHEQMREKQICHSLYRYGQNLTPFRTGLSSWNLTRIVT